MRCEKCNGLMVSKNFYADFCFRCLNCGNWVDNRIIENRKIPMAELVKITGRIGCSTSPEHNVFAL